jgi:hypothetical protein
MDELLQRGGRTAMSPTAREAKAENSKGIRGLGAGIAARLGAAALTVAGIVLLIIAEFTPLLRVQTAIGVEIPHTTVQTGSNHSYALLLVALVAAVFAVGALRTGSRPALLAVALLGLVAVGIAVLGDLPDATQAGNLEKTFEDAKASPLAGLYLETLGAILLLLGAGLGLLISPSGGGGDGSGTAGREPAAGSDPGGEGA